MAAAPAVANWTSEGRESATSSRHVEPRIIVPLLCDPTGALPAKRRRPIQAAATLSFEAYTSLAVELVLTAAVHRSRLAFAGPS